MNNNNTKEEEEVRELHALNIACEVSKKFQDIWETMYNANDPSQVALGQEAWEEQVAAASFELLDDVHLAIENIFKKLVNGEYAKQQR